ncbi:MAG: glycosyltransferase family 4 protein [Bacteroidales bacterium]|nr:glycosyltransferase family 4 protein [Bacteroidales bacterium]
MKIWIVNYYTKPDCTNPRYNEFAKHFQAAGHEVLTFYANYKGDGNSPLFNRKEVGGLDFVEVKAPHYVGNGVARMKSIFSFAWAIKKHCKEFERPDVILHNVHAPFDAPIVLAARKLKCKYVSEVWDLWPDNFANFGMISRKNPAMKLFYRIERWIYEHADERVFTLAGATAYLKGKGWTTETGGKIDLSKVHYINNGLDLDQFDKDKLTHPREDADMNDPNLTKIVYLGAINKANNVKTLIDAAVLLQDMPNYRFIIYGNGVYRPELEQYVKENHIDNVVFKETRIPLEECAWVVSQATVNIMNYEKGFGYMGVSSGKMFQYLAAGKPIVCNVDIAYDNVIKDNNLGVCRDIETSEEFAMAIRSLAEQPRASYDAMCERVREVAKRFDYKVLAQRELEIIESLK